METQLVCPRNDLLALLCAYIVSDLDRVLFVVHQQHLHVGRSPDQKLVETVWHAETRLLVGTIANVGHQDRALELPADAAIDTTRLSPCRIHALEAVGLETRKLLDALLDDLLSVRCHHHL